MMTVESDTPIPLDAVGIAMLIDRAEHTARNHLGDAPALQHDVLMLVRLVRVCLAQNLLDRINKGREG